MCTPGPGRLFIGQYSFKRKKTPQSSENGPVLGLDQKLNKKQPMSNEKHTKRPSEGQENYCSRILFKKKMKTPWKQNIRHCRVAQNFCTVQVKPLENCFKPTVASRG